MKNKTYLFLIIFIILSSSVLSYSVHINQDEVTIDTIRSASTIESNRDLVTNLWGFFNIPSNFTNKKDFITINFQAWEKSSNGLIQINSIEICDYFGGESYSYNVGNTNPCSYKYDLQIKNYTSINSFYQIKFYPKKLNTNQKFMFRIKYLTPKFILKQGDYYVASMNYPNMKNKNTEITNSLTFSTKDDIPRFFPEAKFDRFQYYDEETKQNELRWTFTFEGADERIIWYLNDKEIKENEESLQRKYTIWGAVLGFISAILFWILSYTLKLIWKKYLLKIFNHFFKSKNFIGNINSKKIL